MSNIEVLVKVAKYLLSNMTAIQILLLIILISLLDININRSN